MNESIYNPVINALLGSGPGNLALAALMARLFRAIMILGGLALLLFMAWGGVNWITAGGDKGKVEEAKHRLTNAVLGMVALVGTIAIALFLSGILGFDLLNPTLPGTTPSTNSTGTTPNGNGARPSVGFCRVTADSCILDSTAFMAARDDNNHRECHRCNLATGRIEPIGGTSCAAQPNMSRCP